MSTAGCGTLLFYFLILIHNCLHFSIVLLFDLPHHVPTFFDTYLSTVGRVDFVIWRIAFVLSDTDIHLSASLLFDLTHRFLSFDIYIHLATFRHVYSSMWHNTLLFHGSHLFSFIPEFWFDTSLFHISFTFLFGGFSNSRIDAKSIRLTIPRPIMYLGVRLVLPRTRRD